MTQEQRDKDQSDKDQSDFNIGQQNKEILFFKMEERTRRIQIFAQVVMFLVLLTLLTLESRYYERRMTQLEQQTQAVVACNKSQDEAFKELTATVNRGMDMRIRLQADVNYIKEYVKQKKTK